MPPLLSRPLHATARTTRSRPDVLLVAATCALATVAVLLALLGQYDAGAVVALGSVVTGGVAMMMSATTTERFETVAATLVGAVALAVCLARGSGVFT